MRYLRLAARGFAVTFLVAMNTVQIADRQWFGMAPVSYAISALWWSNSSAQRPAFKWAGTVYAVGAMFGTVAGAAVADWWGR